MKRVKDKVFVSEAEGYHQNYYERNKEESYCAFVIESKIAKLLKEYGQKVKKEFF